jgi:hypothetical protein
MKTIKRYWLALIPFVIASLFALLTIFCPMPTGAQTYSPLIEYVNITHTEYTIIERIEYVQLKPFVSVDELDKFLSSDNTNLGLESKQAKNIQADSSGTVNFGGDCEDYAAQLQRRAAAIGKLLDTETLTPPEYYLYYHKSIPENEKHRINKADIGNFSYYIEPQTDRYWIAEILD